MTGAGTFLAYRRYRVPREDGSALVEPPLDRAGELITANRRGRAAATYDFHGKSLGELAHQARQELLAEARAWTARYVPIAQPASPTTDVLVLAGHQPHLFHPGVWFKNFALGHVAQKHQAVAINLVIDSDTMKSPAVLVPTGSIQHPAVATVPLDEPGPVIPYEERRVQDRTLFRTFGRRAAQALAPLVADPMVCAFWTLVEGRLSHTDNLGQCLAEARHQWEARWGSATLEIPQSRVCSLPAFVWFAAHLLAELPRFVPIHNAAVAEYRRIHRIRSTAHPVPDLVCEDSWIEAPFWVWTANDPQRRRLYVRIERDSLTLSDRQQWQAVLPTPGGDIQPAAERILAWGRQGVKLRSRALITTLWARLVLGDLFIHGIGGAKYDQVTDAIMARFFGVEPPAILVISATLQLPIVRRRATEDDLRQLQRHLRELTWHPEKWLHWETLSDRSTVEALVAEKRRWIQTPQTPENARTRFREIRRINAALQAWVEPRRQELEAQRAELARALRAEAILGSREYCSCLYPAEMLYRFYRDLLGLSPRRLAAARSEAIGGG